MRYSALKFRSRFNPLLLPSFYIFRFDFSKENNRQQCYHWCVGDAHSIELFKRQLDEQHLLLNVTTIGKHYMG